MKKISLLIIFLISIIGKSFSQYVMYAHCTKNKKMVSIKYFDKIGPYNGDNLSKDLNSGRIIAIWFGFGSGDDGTIAYGNNRIVFLEADNFNSQTNQYNHYKLSQQISCRIEDGRIHGIAYSTNYGLTEVSRCYKYNHGFQIENYYDYTECEKASDEHKIINKALSWQENNFLNNLNTNLSQSKENTYSKELTPEGKLFIGALGVGLLYLADAMFGGSSESSKSNYSEPSKPTSTPSYSAPSYSAPRENSYSNGNSSSDKQSNISSNQNDEYIIKIISTSTSCCSNTTESYCYDVYKNGSRIRKNETVSRADDGWYSGCANGSYKTRLETKNVGYKIAIELYVKEFIGNSNSKIIFENN